MVAFPRIAIAALPLSLAIAAGCSGNLSAAGVEPPAPAAQTAAAPAPSQPAFSVPSRGGNSLPDFTTMVERYGPAVVNVAVVEKAQPVAGNSQLAPNDPLQEFFRRFGGQVPRGGGMPQQQQPARGEGSGFIVSPDGYILTNAHVVAGASTVTVKMTDRREYSAKVVGADERTDVAVIKIEAKNLPTVRLGDPSKLKPGEWVIAIGSPFGFENSVTAGIVSATSRSMPGDGQYGAYASFIQTDVAVNPGNSGGPLFNLNGEVVGINSQIYSRTGGYMGLSFAIPIDIANNVREQLVSTGKVTRSRIGVSIQDVNAQLADSFGLDRPRGALVGMVENDGPGEKAGIKAGDVILKVDGKEIEQSSQVPAIVASTKPGTPIQIDVWRDGSNKRLTAKPVEMKEDGEQVASNKESSGNDTKSKLGLAVRSLSAEEKREADTEGSLLVEDVGGPAGEAGVQPGDIILGVNGARVKSLKELQEATKKSGKVVALLIERQNAQIFVPIKVS
jgi:serine protease Do